MHTFRPRFFDARGFRENVSQASSEDDLPAGISLARVVGSEEGRAVILRDNGRGGPELDLGSIIFGDLFTG